MSLEDEPASRSELNEDIKSLLLEVREQRREINCLKDELKGDCLAVKADVKRLKSGQELKWHFEGNKLQHEFNAAILDSITQALWALDNQKFGYASELLRESCDSIKKRNKHVRIADTSEGGWETVRQYELNPVARDSDDESRINRAEARAVKRKKSRKSKSSKPVATVAYNTVSAPAVAGSSMQPQFLPPQQPQQPFRAYPAPRGPRGSYGACFACGEIGHIRVNCPYNRAAAQQGVKKE